MVAIADKDAVSVSSLGDLWVSCWADDDAVYYGRPAGPELLTSVAELSVSYE